MPQIFCRLTLLLRFTIHSAVECICSDSENEIGLLAFATTLLVQFAHMVLDVVGVHVETVQIAFLKFEIKRLCSKEWYY